MLIRSLSMRSVLLVVLCVLAVVSVALGVFLVYVPAGFIVSGVLAGVSAYVIRFMEVQNADS